MREVSSVQQEDKSNDAVISKRDEKDLSKRQRQIYLIGAHMGLNVANLCIPLIARLSVLREASGKSAADAAQLLATLSSGVGALEFFLNPLAGQLSDAFGRKPFLMMAPFVSCILKLFVYLKPSVVSVALERSLSGACTTIGGSTSCSSALADIVTDAKELGRAYATLGTAAGLGVIIGPMVGGLAIGKSGISRRAFGAGAIVSAAQLLCVTAHIKEPLPVSERKPIPKDKMLSAINPLSITKLFTNGPVVALLVTISSLQCFCEGKSLSDLNAYYLLNDAKFNEVQRSLYISCLGIVMAASGMIGRQTIQHLGMRGHTTFQNLATVLGFAIMGCSTRMSVVFGVLPLYAFGMERRAAVNALGAKAAASAGMGKGEFQSASANLRAIAVGIAPLLYARVYGWSLARGRSPGLPFWSAAVIALLAELFHRMLSDKQLDFK